MLRESLFVELGTDALWSDLVRPSRSLLGPRRIPAGKRVNGPLGEITAEPDHDGLMIEPPPVPVPF
jgi:hypothetical protein